jgi:hypothetical protein
MDCDLMIQFNYVAYGEHVHDSVKAPQIRGDQRKEIAEQILNGGGSKDKYVKNYIVKNGIENTSNSEVSST